MYLIRRGEKPKPICRECLRLHGWWECPKLRRRCDERLVLRILREMETRGEVQSAGDGRWRLVG